MNHKLKSTGILNPLNRDTLYSEGLTRTNATGGITIVTFTPLLGMSEVVLLFLSAGEVDRMAKASG
jgi:phage terminase large subunit-like protein